MRRYRVRLSPAARRDLSGIYASVRDGASARIAKAYTDRIKAYVRTFSDAPHRGTPRPDLDPDLRLIGFERRISILFRIDHHEVVVALLMYGGRDIARALDEPDWG